MEKNRGFKRLFFAIIYSFQGLGAALKHEEAFRQEFTGFVIFTALSFYFDVSAMERLLMICSLVLVLIVEVLNSAIETLSDRVSTDKNKLAGRAKDYGSFAVLMTIFIAIATWLTILL